MLPVYKLEENESLFLDFLRVIASQLVVIGHAFSYFKFFKILHYPNVPWMQNIAVVFFFILSGYVITYSTNLKFHKFHYSFKNFFNDRAIRIFTAYIPAILFVLAIDCLSQHVDIAQYAYQTAFNIKTFICNLFMLQDIKIPFKAVSTSFGSARPFWTIAIEWWIYMFFGVAYFAYKKGKLKSIKYILPLIILSPVPIQNLLRGRGKGLFLFWIMGCLIYYFYPRYKQNLKLNSKNLLFICSTLIITVLRKIDTRSAYDKFFALCLALLIMFTMFQLRNKIFSVYFKKIIRFFASYSFTLYLIHYSILDFIYRHYSHYQPGYKVLLGFVVSNILSFGIGYIFEIKVTTFLKKRFCSLKSKTI